MKKQPSNLSRLMQYAGSHRYLTYASWILSAGSALLALVPFWYLWKIIAEVIDVMPDFSKAGHLIQNGWLAVLFAVLSFVVYVGGLMCSHLSAFRVATNLRLQMLHYLAELPLGFTQQFGSGKLRKTINESSGATETYLAHMLPDTANAIATPIGLIALLLFFDWKLGLLSLIPVAAGFLVMTSMTGENMKKKMEEYQNALDEMSNEAVEYVRGIPVVKTFGQTVFSFQRFKQSIDRYKTWTIAYTKDLRVPMMLYTTVINGVFAVLIAAALVMTRNGVTDIFLLNLLFYIIITPVISLTMTKMMFMSENGMIVADALKRVDTILDAAPLSNNAAGTVPTDASIQLQHVSYSYDGKRNALDDVSLTIPSGKTAAFVGSSGSGKTTVSRLAARFWDTKQGTITVGGMDISKVDPETLMTLYSIVFQDVTLFHDTILENIRLGKKGATDEEVLRAAKLANCNEFAEKLPNGYQTMIGENGSALSGGERQRISIARAFLKDAPIILLDEATASLDVENETLIQTALSRLIADKTVLMIAHRMRTVANADKVLVLKDGTIVESGTPEELMQKQNGLFRHMTELQKQSSVWEVGK